MVPILLGAMGTYAGWSHIQAVGGRAELAGVNDQLAMVQDQAQQEMLRTAAERDRADAALGQVDVVLADLAVERERNTELAERLQEPTPTELARFPWELNR